MKNAEMAERIDSLQMEVNALRAQVRENAAILNGEHTKNPKKSKKKEPKALDLRADLKVLLEMLPDKIAELDCCGEDIKDYSNDYEEASAELGEATAQFGECNLYSITDRVGDLTAASETACGCLTDGAEGIRSRAEDLNNVIWFLEEIKDTLKKHNI